MDKFFIKACLLMAGLGLSSGLVGCQANLSQNSTPSSASRLSGLARTLSVDSTGSWMRCADENGFCTFSGSTTVRYGANGIYSQKDFTNGTACSNSVFGDPLQGVYKACDILVTSAAVPPTAGTWTHCASENAFCSFSGAATVRYGANGTFVQADFSNGVACSNSIFGDPLPGVYKSCDYLSIAQPAPAPPVAPVAPPVAPPPAPSTAPAMLGSGASVSIQNLATGLCLANTADSTAAGNPQTFETCAQIARQVYSVSTHSDGSVSLANSISGRCLDIPYAVATAGTVLQQYDCNGTAAQNFKPVQSGSVYKFVSSSNSLCLDASRADGRLQQSVCQSSPAQNFAVVTNSASLLIPVAPPVPAPVPAPVPIAPPMTSGSPKTGAGYNKGMAVGLYYLDGAQLASAVADLKSMGVTWVRMDFPWSEMQPNDPNSYNTAAWDRAVQATTAAGIQILGIIDYTPAWARAAGTNKFYPPSNTGDYGTFAGYLARRYAPMGVHTWEIWNEENGSTFFQPAPNPGIYVSMLKAASQSLKAADAKAFVILGGMATFGDDGINQNARTFLSNVYASGGGAYFDAVGMHPYTYPTLPLSSVWNNWGQMGDATPSLRSIMISQGDGAKQIWMTELGYPTISGNAQLTEQGQKDYLTQAYQAQASYSWAGPLFWYTYQDSGSNPGNPEDWFGLLRNDGSHKPSYDAYKALPK